MHSVKEPVPPFVPEHEQMPGRKPAIGAQMASSSLQVAASAAFAGVFALFETEMFVPAVVAGPEEGVAEGVGGGDAEGVGGGDAEGVAEGVALHVAMPVMGHCVSKVPVTNLSCAPSSSGE